MQAKKRKGALQFIQESQAPQATRAHLTANIAFFQVRSLVVRPSDVKRGTGGFQAIELAYCPTALWGSLAAT